MYILLGIVEDQYNKDNSYPNYKYFMWLFKRSILTFIYARVMSSGGSDGKALFTMRETWVQSLGQEDLLEKEMAIHSSTLAWKIPWMEKPGRLQSVGSQRVGQD